jgi:hypothetical protein
MANNYWIKLYHEILDDAKVGRLRVALKWRFVECLLVAGENGNDGLLPETADLAWRLRCDAEKLETDLTELSDVGLLNRVDGQWLVVKFKQRQEPSKAAQRMRRYRQRKKEAKKETNIDTNTEADTDSYRARNALRNASVTHGNRERPPSLPAFLASPEMLNEWGEWCQYHAETGKPMVWGAAKEQFVQFKEWGEEKSIAAMKYSRMNKYTGLVLPDRFKNKRHQRETPLDRSQAAIQAALGGEHA